MERCARSSCFCVFRFSWGFFILLLIGIIGRQASAQFTTRGTGGWSQEHGVLAPFTPPSVKDGTGKKLLIMYVVGSDLESGGNAGTTDFNELIDGFKKLKVADSVDVIVAFGGSSKAGWQGMKFATMAQIVQDGQDGKYGNASGGAAYLYKESRAHMGDESSLKLFLQYVSEGYVNYSQRFLAFWDHGGSYDGFGNDEVYNSDPLSLEEIDRAFTESGVGHLDLIGFDACLMAAMEVAQMVKKHADYMLASEELEPGHGWQWDTILTEFEKNTSLVEYGRAIINNYVEDVHPYWSDGKTLSIVDLRRFDEVRAKTNVVAQAFAGVLDTFSPDQKALVKSNREVQVYGQQGREDSRVSIDLHHLAELVKEKSNNTTLHAQLNDLIQALNLFVIHSRHDGTKPNSYGISIIAPENDPIYTTLYGTPELLTYQEAYHKLVVEDVVAPVIESQNDDADPVPVGVLTYDPDEAGLAGSDPAFQYWQEEQSNPIWDDYFAGLLTEEEFYQKLDEIYFSDEDEPAYIDWLLQQESSSEIPPYLGDWNIDWSEIPLQIGGIAPNSLVDNISYPFLTGERAAFVAVNDYSSGPSPRAVDMGIKGVAAQFFDPNLTSVGTMFGHVFTFEGEEGFVDDWFIAVSGVQAYQTETEGLYFSPRWNRQWYFMQYDADEDPVYIPIYYQNKVKIRGRIFSVYSAEIDYLEAGKDYSGGGFEIDPYGEPVEYATLNIYVSSNNKIVGHSVQTYQIVVDGPDDQEGTVQYDKLARKLNIGDRIRFYEEGINLTRPGNDYWFDTGYMIELTQDPEYFVDELEFDDLEGNALEYKYIMQAEDLSGNVTLTRPAAAQSPNGTAVTDWSVF